MKRIIKKIVIGVGIFVGLILFLIASLFLQGTCFEKAKNIENKDNSIWMSYIKDDTKLNDIVIPGSHDAGTEGIIYLSSTQNATIQQQLEMGGRYFDLRVRKESDDYYLYHSLFNGERFIPVIDDIVSFITENPSETLLLDFQHFDKGAKSDVYSIVKEKIVDKGLALKNNSGKDDLAFISNVALKDARGKCVIFFGEGTDYTEESFIFERNNDASSKTGMSLNSTYIKAYNKMSSKKYIENGLPEYIEQIKGKIESEGYKGIFVLQGQLTDGKYIIGPYSRERRHNKYMTEYIDSLRKSSDLELINVIMRDFINEEKNEQIISLNYDKGLIKDEFLDSFIKVYNS